MQAVAKDPELGLATVALHEVPRVGPDDVLVRVRYAVVDPIDLYILDGVAGKEVRMSTPIVGCSAYGVVETVGARASSFSIGDEVWGVRQCLGGGPGTWAEFTVMDHRYCYRVPDNIEIDRLLGYGVSGITAYLALICKAAACTDDTVLIHGALGNVGHSLMHLCRALGIAFVTTTGNPRNVARCLEAGAAAAFCYLDESWPTQVQASVDRNISVVIPTSREHSIDAYLRVLSGHGRIVLLSGRNAQPTLPIGPLYLQDISIHGFALFNASAEELCSAAESLMAFVESGHIPPRPLEVFDLSDVRSAVALKRHQTFDKSKNGRPCVVLRLG